jgi:hypothetical protein
VVNVFPRRWPTACRVFSWLASLSVGVLRCLTYFSKSGTAARSD